MNQVTACGILPLAYYNGEWYVLCGQERYSPMFDGSLTFCGFGGHKNKGESNRRCASREGYEESMGFLGTEDELFAKLSTKHNDYLGINVQRSYANYLIKIPYNEGLPKLYNDVYQYFYQCIGGISQKVIDNGCLEKVTVRWWKLKDLYKYSVNSNSYSKKMFREYFLEDIKKIMENKEFVKTLKQKSK